MSRKQRELGEGAVRMPTLDQHRNIEHLCGYVLVLNRGRGMGFVIYLKPIRHSFAIVLGAKIASLISISLPVLLSLTRVEEEEAEMINCSKCANL